MRFPASSSDGGKPGSYVVSRWNVSSSTTPVVSLDTLHREPLYLPGFPPSDEEVGKRIETYWRPYHQRLQQALAETKAKHGYALLWDAHSIFSVLPRFFRGKLSDFNLGTADGKSCAPGLG